MVPTPDSVTPNPPLLPNPKLKDTHEAVEGIREVEQEESGGPAERGFSGFTQH